jgi:hypothetical protein
MIPDTIVVKKSWNLSLNPIKIQDILFHEILVRVCW